MKRWQGEDYASSPYLPPRELWLFNPEVDEKLPTPIDDLGLVDVKKLIVLVKSTIDPSFVWDTSERADIHHLYYPHCDYQVDPTLSVDPHEFCELAINKIIIPRKFHAVLHNAVAPPPRPCDETIRNRARVQEVVNHLFRTASQSEQLTRARYITDERLRRGLMWHFQDFYKIIEEARALPQEFQPYDLSQLQPEKETDLHKIVPILGKMALSSMLVREIAEPLAA